MVTFILNGHKYRRLNNYYTTYLALYVDIYVYIAKLMSLCIPSSINEFGVYSRTELHDVMCGM